MGTLELSIIIAFVICVIALGFDLYFTHKKLKEKTEAEIQYRRELIRTLKYIRMYYENKITEDNVNVSNDD